MRHDNIIRNIVNSNEEFLWHVTGSIADIKYNPIYWILTIVTIGLFAIALHYKRTFYSYVLTNQRLIIISGIFSISVDEIELFRVVDSATDQSLVDVWANIGNIAINSTDKTGSVYMRKIPNPHAVRDILRQQYTLARQKKGTVVLESLAG